jgi:hypothetical protein
VLQELKKANFDPEFFREFENELVDQYNDKLPDAKVKSSSKRGLYALFG